MALPTLAATPPLTADRDAVRVAGVAGKAPLGGTLRLIAGEEVGGFKLLVSDLMDDGDGPTARDPIAASAVAVMPAVEGGRLAAGVQQFFFQVSVPPETGRWKGTVLALWDKPAAGRMELPIVVSTRSQPTLALATAQQLSFSGASGESIQFRFQLKETGKGSPTQGVKVIATDLRGTTGTRLLSAENVRAALQSDTLAGGGLMPVSVSVDLRDVKSGKYAGQLMVTDAYHNDLAVPLEVSVKDRWPLPLAVLLFGVAAGMTISGYRARGRTRDELTVRMDAINAQAADAGRLAPALQPLVRRIAVDVSAHIDGKRWDPAKDAAGRAEALIVRWRSDEEAWWGALERLERVKTSLEALSGAVLGQQLGRHLERLDLAALGSAKALADEVDRAEDLLAFYEHGRALLAETHAQIESLSSPGAKRGLGAELFKVRASLAALRADDKQSAEALRGSAHALQEKVRAALVHEDTLREEIAALEAAADDIRTALAKPAATKVGRSIAGMARELESESAGQPLYTRRQRIENLWRGLWSASAMLQLVARDPKNAEEKALCAWLSEPRHYGLSTADFKARLEMLEDRLPDSSWPESVRPSVPGTPQAREMTGKGARAFGGSGGGEVLAASYTSLQPGAAEAPAEPAPRASARILGSLLKRVHPRTASERSRLRLALFRYGSYALALGVLVWLGYAELYAASPTFGAEGTKDYLVLFLWGFGAEATRSAVTEVVKGLVPAS